jgi:molybdopterin synthase catalytic subunit
LRYFGCPGNRRVVERVSTVSSLSESIKNDTEWILVSDSPLPVSEALAWASLDSCGGVVTFCGTVRDYSAGRPGVRSLTYEAYVEQVVPKLSDVADAARVTWPMIGRLVLLHRVGTLDVGDVAVVVVASTPHRAEAFDVARFCIDTLKHTIPIWKRETWDNGSEWVRCDHEAEGHASDDAAAAQMMAGLLSDTPRGR